MWFSYISLSAVQYYKATKYAVWVYCEVNVGLLKETFGFHCRNGVDIWKVHFLDKVLES